MTDHGPGSRAAMAALLDFFIEAGVDIGLDDTPVDRFRESAEARATAVAQRQTERDASPAAPARPAPAASIAPIFGHESDDPAKAARELALGADTLEALHLALARFDGCALRKTAKNLVFSDGTPHARVMFVGEAPGRDEDLQGKPFVGRSGRLLDRMLQAIGLDRATNAYIANIVPWRPPGNRTPTPQEAATCHPFIQRQIELCDPDILVCLGGPSVQALLGVREGILRTRGRWFTYNTGRRDIRALATLHPAYLLRQPLQKRLAWRDFRALRAGLRESDASKSAPG